MKRRHDEVLARYVKSLRLQGKRIASEVGLPGGRLDAVRLDARDRWVELYELKTRAATDGIEQLKRYAALVDGEPRLTLVVTADVASPLLASMAAEAGVNYEIFEGFQQSLFLDGWELETYVDLPWQHPVSTESARQKNMRYWSERRARHFSREQAAA